MNRNVRQGVRLQGPLTTIVANGAAGALAVFQVSNFAGQVGVKTMVLKRLTARSNGIGADTWLHIGLGVGAGVDVMTPIRLVNNFNLVLTEDDLPDVEFGADIVAWCDVVIPGTCQVQVEVDEVG